MNKTFDRTFNAIISLAVVRDRRLVLFFDGESQRAVFAFDQEKSRDVKMLERLCQFAGITNGNLTQLDHCSFRLISNKDPESNAYGIGHEKEDLFFILNGNGELMSQEDVYEIMK